MLCRRFYLTHGWAFRWFPVLIIRTMFQWTSVEAPRYFESLQTSPQKSEASRVQWPVQGWNPGLPGFCAGVFSLLAWFLSVSCCFPHCHNKYFMESHVYVVGSLFLRPLVLTSIDDLCSNQLLLQCLRIPPSLVTWHFGMRKSFPFYVFGHLFPHSCIIVKSWISILLRV